MAEYSEHELQIMRRLGWELELATDPLEAAALELELAIIRDAKELVGATLTEERHRRGPLPITLTADYQTMVEREAIAKFKRREHTPHKWNRPEGDHTLEKERDAMGAEPAGGMVIGVPWTPSPYPDKAGDIGPGNQVRHTLWPNGKLIIHPEDIDGHRFILVTGKFPHYVVVGWQHAEVVKRLGPWESLDKYAFRPAWTFTQDKLRDMGEWK